MMCSRNPIHLDEPMPVCCPSARETLDGEHIALMDRFTVNVERRLATV